MGRTMQTGALASVLVLVRKVLVSGVATCLVVAAVGLPAVAQPVPAPASVAALDSTNTRPLSLDEAVTLAEQHSPVVRLARAAVVRARGQQYQARSALFPQLNGNASYTRTLRSQFQGAFGSSSSADTGAPAPAPPCTRYLLGQTATTEERVLGLEEYAHCAAANGGGFGGIDFSRVGFGARNAYTLGLNASQNLFTGGRISGQTEAAAAGRRSAEIELTAQRAQLTLDVTQAYYDAALSDRLLAIAQTTLSQADALLQQVQLQQRVGNTSEFELLRATVARDNQRPVVLQRESQREVAHLRLKQLLDVPLDQSLRLTTPIEDSAASAPPGVSLARAATPDTVTGHRAAVREATENVAAQRGALRVARSERFPSLSLSSAYAQLAYPNGGPALGDFHPNWTVTLSTSFPLLTGGRLRGDEMVAQANLRDAETRLVQSRQYAALDARVARSTLREAEAALAAIQGTADVAQRAYQIAQVRYREGLSTQLELNDAQTQLAQALVNRAQATRDVLVARVRLALLPDLPVQTQPAGQTGLSMPSTQPGAQSPSMQQSTQQPAASAATGQSATPAGTSPSGGSF